MKDYSRIAAKFFLYLAPLSTLIVASGLFFPFIVGKAIFFRAVIELGFLSYLIFLLSSNNREEKANLKNIVKNPLFLALAAFTLIFLLASVFAVNSQLAFWSNFERGEGAVQFVHYFLFFALTVLLLKSKNEWRNYLSWIWGAGILVSAYALGQRYLGPNAGFYGDASRVSGTLGNPLYLSAFIIFLYFITAYLFQEYKNIIARYTLILGAAFFTVIFFMTESRNGFIGVALGLVSLLLYFIFRKNSQNIKWGGLRLISGIVLAVMVIFGLFFYFTRTPEICAPYFGSGTSLEKTCSSIANRWISVPGASRFAKPRLLSGLDDRTWVWGAAVSAFVEKPILGWGPENFPYPFDKYYNPKHFGSDSWFDRAHDVYLEYLMDGGILLLAAYLAIWGSYFYIIAKRRKKLSFFMLGLLIALPVAYLVQGISAFEVLPIYLMLYAFLAFTIRLTDEEDQKTPENRGERPVPLSNFLAIAAAAFAVAFAFYFADYLPLKKNMLLIATSEEPNPGKVLQKFNDDFNFYSPVGQQESVQYYFLFVLNLLDSAGKAAAKSPDLMKNPQFITGVKDLVANSNKIFETNENSPFREIGVKTLNYDGLLYYKAAAMLNDKDLLAEAQKKLEKGHEIAPTRFEFIYPLLDIAAVKKDKDMARPLLSEAVFLRPDLDRNLYYGGLFSLPGTTTAAKVK